MQIQIKEINFSISLKTNEETSSYIEYIRSFIDQKFGWVNQVIIETSFYGLRYQGLTTITINKEEGLFVIHDFKKENRDIHVLLYQTLAYIGGLSLIFKKNIEIVCKFQ